MKAPHSLHLCVAATAGCWRQQVPGGTTGAAGSAKVADSSGAQLTQILRPLWPAKAHVSQIATPHRAQTVLVGTFGCAAHISLASLVV
jgi:hypothetical protein